MIIHSLWPQSAFLQKRMRVHICAPVCVCVCRPGERIAPHCCPFCLSSSEKKKGGAYPNTFSHTEIAVFFFFVTHRTESFQLRLPIWLPNNRGLVHFSQRRTKKKVPHFQSSFHTRKGIITDGWLDYKTETCLFLKSIMTLACNSIKKCVWLIVGLKKKKSEFKMISS